MTLTATTNASGDATVNGETSVFGRLEAVEWVLGTFDAGVDATLTCQATLSGVAQTLLTLTNANANALYYPRALVHDATGGALTGTSGGDRTLMLLTGKPRVVIAQGGNVKTGAVILYYWSA
jgi:hypothetical protein